MPLNEADRNKYTAMLMESLVIGMAEFYMDKYKTAERLETSVMFERALNPQEQVEFKQEKNDIVDRAATMMASFAMLADEGMSFEEIKRNARESFVNSLKDDNVNDRDREGGA